jgi:hypothetical protein
MPMRGIAVLLAYLVGLSALLSVGVIGVMAFHSSTKPIPPAQPVVTSSQKERLAKPAKQTTTVTQKEARPQKRKVAHVNRKRKEEMPMVSSGFDAYGYAQEPRRFYQYPNQFFGR